MRYAEFLERTSFNKTELLAISQGNLVEDPPPGGLAKLPAPPFLMFDRITSLTKKASGGTLVAEQDVHPDAWYFQCHFLGDPVQPGCLGLDAIWQLLGLFCQASGAVGSGRALGCGEVEFFGQIRPYDGIVRYQLDVRRFSTMAAAGSAIALANGEVYVRDELIYTIKNARVGLFRDIAYQDYPNPDSPRARGGIMNRSRTSQPQE